jgi:DNA primase
VIPDDVVEEVRARADIVDVIGEFLPLKRAGKDFKATCPFHEERTPSFYVVPSKGFYKCFGCGESGDVFTFVMRRLGLDFLEAVRYVGSKAGVEVREVAASRGDEDPHREYFEANAFAKDFYVSCLWDPHVGGGARRYLESRGIGRETAERYGLGFAPEGWRQLREAAARHDIPEELLLEVGLLTTSERAAEPYDRFRGRIVFPIEGLSSRVLAFGGRVIGPEAEGAPKYLNSPESPIYHKGEVLYGLSWARHEIRREGTVLVVEGYMDVVSLAAAGLGNVVAPLGTAMTEAQAALLSRYCSRVLLLFDSDPAGLRATFRAGDILLAAGLHPSVVTFPRGEDPDSVVHQRGTEALREYLGQALDVLDRKMQILDEKKYFDSIERTRRAIDRLLPTLRAALDPALRDIYIAKVAGKTGVRRETLESEIGRAGKVGAPERRRGPRFRVSDAGPVLLGAERNIVLLMLKDRGWIHQAADRLRPQDFADPVYGNIFQALVTVPDLSQAPEEMDPVTSARLEELLADGQEIAQAGKVFEESVGRILGSVLDRQLQEVDAEIRKASDEDRLRELLAEKEQLARERRAIDRDWSSLVRSSLRTQPSETEE